MKSSIASELIEWCTTI